MTCTTEGYKPVLRVLDQFTIEAYHFPLFLSLAHLRDLKITRKARKSAT